METKFRQKRNWPNIIADWEKSGKSIKDYCSENGIYKSDFYRMRKKIKTPEPNLVKIRTVNNPTPIGTPIIIETPQNYRLQISEGFSPELLKQILSILSVNVCS